MKFQYFVHLVIWNAITVVCIQTAFIIIKRNNLPMATLYLATTPCWTCKIQVILHQSPHNRPPILLLLLRHPLKTNWSRFQSTWVLHLVHNKIHQIQSFYRLIPSIWFLLQLSITVSCWFNMQAIHSCWHVIYYIDRANKEDPNELSFTKGEVIYVHEKKGSWWQAKKSDGTIGMIPSNYVN